MDLVGGGDGVRKGFRFGYRLGLRALDGKAGLGWEHKPNSRLGENHLLI